MDLELHWLLNRLLVQARMRRMARLLCISSIIPVISDMCSSARTASGLGDRLRKLLRQMRRITRHCLRWRIQYRESTTGIFSVSKPPSSRFTA